MRGLPRRRMRRRQPAEHARLATLLGRVQRTRWPPRRSTLRLGPPIMIGGDAGRIAGSMAAPIALFQPRSLDDAIGVLQARGEDARVIAGGTAMTILLRQGLVRPAALVSLGGIAGLNGIERTDGELHIGALVTHRQVELSPVVRESVPVVADTFAKVANVRVRHAATVGGVLAEADYASDPPAVLLALDAQVDVQGPGGQRTIPIKDFFQGFYETSLQPGEIVTRVRVPVPRTGTRAVYEKYVTRSSEDRPCLGVVAVVEPDQGLRVAVGAVAETPQRFPDVEALAHGRGLDDSLIRQVADGYAEKIEPLSDMRGSAWYRTEMIRVWVRRAIERARDNQP
jgi:aerobic carbon-monoxide dehydrogenase medium subunit